MDDVKPVTTKNKFGEYLILVVLIAIGTPAFLVLGLRDGDKLAAQAFAPKASAPKAAPAATPGGDMYAPSAENIERGHSLFLKNCTACHGENADGQGPAAVAFTPPPRNFTDPNAKWTHSREPREIFKTVSTGIAGTGMASFAALPEADRWALVHFIGSLPGVKGKFTPLDEKTTQTLHDGEHP